MWQENRPEALGNLPLRVLLHRAWLERKKNFDSIIEFTRCNPFCTDKIDFINEINDGPRLLAVKADLPDCPTKCTQCCTQGPKIPQLITKAERLREIEDSLSSGECSGLIIITGFDEGDLPEALKHWNCAVTVSPKQFIYETGNLAEEKLEQLCTGLRKLIKSGIPISLLILVSEEIEQNFQLLVKLAELQLPVLTLLFDMGTGRIESQESAEQYGRLGAMVRILNPKAELGCACIGSCRQQASLLEQYILNAGFNTISCPSEETVSLARDMGLEPRFKERCCLVRSGPWLEEKSFPLSN